MREEKGAVSALVLFTVLFFIAILGGSYFAVASMQSSQLESDLRIQEIYREPVNEIDNVYASIKGVCKIEDKYYLTIADAITDASSESLTTIQIIKDVEENITIPTGKKIRLQLNNNQITGQIVNNGTLEINKGKVYCADKTVVINKGEITINEAIITTDNPAVGTFVSSGTSAKVTMVSGEVSNTAPNLVSSSYRANAMEINGGEAILMGGKISSICGRAIGNHGTIAICGTEMTSASSDTSSYAIFATVCNFSEGTLPAGVITMTSGSITNTGGGYAVANGAGSANFTKTGGTITGTTWGI